MQTPMVLYISMVSFQITAHLCTMRLFTAPRFTFCRISDGLIMTNYFGILRLSVISGQQALQQLLQCLASCVGKLQLASTHGDQEGTYHANASHPRCRSVRDTPLLIE
jgi:hypothetical protein